MQFNRSTFAITALLGLLALAAPIGACRDAPADPTFTNDVQPLLQANCIRCHSYPARGGAPESFRLDVYDSTVLMDGTQIRGAKVMAQFLRRRAGVEGSMPPDFPRGDVMRETLKNWFRMAGGDPARGGHASNSDPVAILLTDLPETVDKDMLELTFEVSDGDADIVHGHFSVNIDGDVDKNVKVADGLHSGRGTLRFYTGSFPAGDHDLVADMSDGRAPSRVDGNLGHITEYPVRQVIGTLRVRHADGNTAPTLTVFRRGPATAQTAATLDDPGTTVVDFFNHAMLADAQSPAIVAIKVRDDDDADTHQLALIAFRGDEEIVIESQIDYESQLDTMTNSVNYLWDTTVMPEGPGWHLRVVATDSQGASTTLETGTIHISHHTTTLTFDGILSILNPNCGECHTPPVQKSFDGLALWETVNPTGSVPDLSFTLEGAGQPKDAQGNPVDIDPADEASVRAHLVYAEFHRVISYNAGNIYKRVAQEKNMPPVSADGLRGVELSDEDRATLADYFLGGAPKE